MNLQIYEEQVTPTGGPKSEGVQKVLGQPPMNWITVVLREAVQNSWDARSGRGPVDFEIRWWQPNRDQKSALLSNIFLNEPSKSGIRNGISEKEFDVLVFTDRGTRGLSGPIAANAEGSGNEKRNFVDFVWDVGRSEDAGNSGGTYGYGKTSFFRMSQLRTVCIYTRCINHGKSEDRFIAAHLGPSSPKRTGRVWWGNCEKGGISPVVGASATKIAKAIGMPPYDDADCGTSIMMLCPRMRDLSPEKDGEVEIPENEKVLAMLAESIVQWFWPKILKIGSKEPEMRFHIYYEGREYPVPAPESIAPFNVFSEAFRLLAEWRRTKSLPHHSRGWVIECGRPHAVIGHLVMVKRAKKPRNENCGEYGESIARELYSQAHHVALMRKPNLVVKYLRGMHPPSNLLDYAGVFLVDDSQLNGEIERAFALCEPPTHDDWIPETLEDRHHKTFVRVCLRRLRESFADFATPINVDGGSEKQDALGVFSEALGGLLAGSTDGSGARIQPIALGGGGAGGSGGSSGKKSRVEIHGVSKVLFVDGVRCLSVPFRIIPRKGENQFRVRITPAVLLEQGSEKEPPKNAAVPRVYSFCHIVKGKAEVVAKSCSEVVVPLSKIEGEWIAYVTLPAEAKIRVDVGITNQ